MRSFSSVCHCIFIPFSLFLLPSSDFFSLFPCIFLSLLSFRSKSIPNSAFLVLQGGTNQQSSQKAQRSYVILTLPSFQAQKSFAHIMRLKTEVLIIFFFFPQCLVALSEIKTIKLMSFLLYTFVYIHLCRSYLDTVTVWKTSQLMEKRKKGHCMLTL